MAKAVKSTAVESHISQKTRDMGHPKIRGQDNISTQNRFLSTLAQAYVG
jgi:hypothetical protein